MAGNVEKFSTGRAMSILERLNAWFEHAFEEPWITRERYQRDRHAYLTSLAYREDPPIEDRIAKVKLQVEKRMGIQDLYKDDTISSMIKRILES